jgi:asparagine synthase (glutamine-hydrolysing)
MFARPVALSPLAQMMCVDSATWLPDDLLLKADKMTMATSVELRVPLLDHRILAFAAALPDRFKVSGWALKRVLKAALRGTVPDVVLDRPKTGFPVPYAPWLRNELRDFVADSIKARDGGLDAYLQPAAVSRLLAANVADGSCPKEVFSLLVLALWHRQFAGSRVLAQAA